MEHRPVAFLASWEAVLKRGGLPKVQFTLRYPTLIIANYLGSIEVTAVASIVLQCSSCPKPMRAF